MTRQISDNDTMPEDADEQKSLSSSAETAFEDLIRVEGLWFEEDNLILRADDTIFRVSKGVLAALSPVFKTVFGVPQPEADAMYGCQVIHLDFCAQDVTYFLRAIFDPNFFLPPPAKSRFRVVIGVLRIAHEYAVQPFIKRALLHMETFFPSSLDAKKVYDDDDECLDVGGILSCDLEALQVATEVGALWNLPSIIYECCTFSLTEIMDRGEWDILPTSLKRQVLLSHGKQKYGASTVSDFLLADSADDCKEIENCNAGKLRWLKVVDNWRKEGRDSVPLEFWDDSDWNDMAVDGDFCEACLAEFKRSYSQQRKLFWEGLPKIFGLPDWDELLKMKAGDCVSGKPREKAEAEAQAQAPE